MVVVRREDEEPIKRAGTAPVEGRRSRGRQGVWWRDGLQGELQRMRATEEDAMGRNNW